jgi:hypothetical protein
MRTRLVVLGSANAVLAVLLAASINYATDQLPEILAQHRVWAWLLVALFGFGSVLCGVLLLNTTSSPSSGDSQTQVGGINVGRDFRVRGQNHSIIGYNSTLHEDELNNEPEP